MPPISPHIGIEEKFYFEQLVSINGYFYMAPLPANIDHAQFKAVRICYIKDNQIPMVIIKDTVGDIWGVSCYDFSLKKIVKTPVWVLLVDSGVTKRFNKLDTKIQELTQRAQDLFLIDHQITGIHYLTVIKVKVNKVNQDNQVTQVNLEIRPYIIQNFYKPSNDEPILK